MAHAICYRCGAAKDAPRSLCPICNFRYDGGDEAGECLSLMLSQQCISNAAALKALGSLIMLELLDLETRKDELYKATNTQGYRTDVGKALAMINNMAADAQRPLLSSPPSRLDEFPSWQFWRKRHKQMIHVLYPSSEKGCQPVERLLDAVKSLGYSLAAMSVDVGSDKLSAKTVTFRNDLSRHRQEELTRLLSRATGSAFSAKTTDDRLSGEKSGIGNNIVAEVVY